MPPFLLHDRECASCCRYEMNFEIETLVQKRAAAIVSSPLDKL
jgi:hypothetical protein